MGIDIDSPVVSHLNYIFWPFWACGSDGNILDNCPCPPHAISDIFEPHILGVFGLWQRRKYF